MRRFTSPPRTRDHEAYTDVAGQGPGERGRAAVARAAGHRSGNLGAPLCGATLGAPLLHLPTPHDTRAWRLCPSMQRGSVVPEAQDECSIVEVRDAHEPMGATTSELAFDDGRAPS